jgi:hypothetical protein
MRRLTSWTLRLGTALSLLLGAAAASVPAFEPDTRRPAPVTLVSAPATAATAQQAPPAKCCFTNPRYSGTCEVAPAKDESCGQILGYLNNPLSQGKSYCGNTAIRGGWQSVSCEAKK